MKTKAIVRAIDDVGRVTLPKYFRDSLEMENGNCVEITLQEDHIVIKKAVQEDICNNED